MDTGKIITLAAVGLGLYILYEWLTSQCETVNSSMFGSSTCSMLLGTSALPAVTVPTSSTTLASTTPVVTTAAPTTAQTNTAYLAAQLTQAATNAGNDPTQLSADQWSYFYQQIPGKPAISASTFESILQSLGLTDATRATFVTATQFAAALGSNGLSGFGTFFPNRVSAGLIHGGWA
jgi:hypothetical protein